jgi:cyclic-di-GMP phosphodiesterase TipF (flagellum assembly factor)
MIRFGATFVAFCILLIAASAGVIAYLYFGVSGVEATVLALAAFTGLALYNAVTTRVRGRGDLVAQLAELAHGSADLTRHVADLGQRVAAVEARVDGAIENARTVAQPLAAEIGVLGTLVKQLAETVAIHDAAINRVGAAARWVPAPLSERGPKASPPPHPAEISAKQGTDAAKSGPREAMAETVRKAVEAGRIDLYLQPIVTLPQRKVRYYEALSRLRAENGDVAAAAEFIDAAEAAGLMAAIDNLALFRSVQVARGLMRKGRDIGMFCNMAGATLADVAFLPQLTEFIDANPTLCSALVFEFTQRTVRALGPMEQESLASLAERGFRFSMDQVTDLRIEPRQLSERGFRFVKVPASLLLSQASAADSDIHPADLSNLLGRHGIELIAGGIESEGTVVDVLDFGARYGQGFLFSPPRPVRQDALRGTLDRGEGLARERRVGDDRLAAGRTAGGLAHVARSA